MEGLEKIAVKLYNDSSEAEKEKICEMFRGIDSDGDGKVTFEELRDCGLFTNELSYILDRYGQHLNGVMGFDGFLIFFLHTFGPVMQLLGKYEPGRRICDGCRRRQVSPDFSCFFCLEKFPDTYDLCYECHERGVDADHEHEEKWCMLNHESLALLEFFRHGLISTHFVQELKARRTINVPTDNSMSDDVIISDLLQIGPLKLQFPFFFARNVVLSISSCPMRVTNISNFHVMILMTGFCRQRHELQPNNRQILLPHATVLFSVSMGPPTKVSLESEGKDKFFIHSMILSPEFTKEDISAKMFGEEPSKWVKEWELEAFNVAFPPPMNGLMEDCPMKMGTSKHIEIEPEELRFPFVLGKRSACCLQLTNKSSDHVGIKVAVKNAHSITVSDRRIVMPPHSTKLIYAKSRHGSRQQPVTPSPAVTQCGWSQQMMENDNKSWDMLYIRSVLVLPGFIARDLTSEMFKLESGKVEVCRLRIVYIYVPPSVAQEEEAASGLNPPAVDEFKVERTIFVPMNRSTWPIVEMITGNLLQIEPHELHFQFFLEGKVVLGKRSSCSLKLTNESAYHVAIMMSYVGNQEHATDYGGAEVLLPHSTKLLTVYIMPPTKAPLECDDKFFIQSAIVSPGLSRSYITPEMFEGDSGNWVEECKLSVVYVNVPPLKESVRTVTPINISTNDQLQIEPPELLLQIEPPELRLPFVPGKDSFCWLRLTNNSNHHVGYQTRGRSTYYSVSGPTGILMPNSTILIHFSITKPPEEYLLDMECTDKNYIYSVVVPDESTSEDITDDMFNGWKPGNGVEKYILPIVYTYVIPTSEVPKQGSSIKPLIDGPKVQREIHVPTDISGRLIAEMITSNLLQVEPLEVQFPFILPTPNEPAVFGQTSSCSLRLTNEYNYHVAFKVRTKNQSKFDINPHLGVMLPHSTVDVRVSTWIDFQSDFGIHNFNTGEVPLHMDKFLITSLVVPPEFADNDITKNTFYLGHGNWMETCALKAVYVPIRKEGQDEEDSSYDETTEDQPSETNCVSESLEELTI